MFGPFSFALDYYMNPIMLEFSAGCLLGIVYARVDISKWPFPRALGYGLIGMGAIVIALPDAVFPGLLHLTRDSFSGSMTRCGIFGIPAFMIVAGALVLEKAGHLWKGRALLLQGAASYAIYLFHTVGMQGFVKAMAFVFPAKDFSMGLIVMILSMIFIGCIGTGVHLFVEKPLQKMMKAKKLSFSVKTT